MDNRIKKQAYMNRLKVLEMVYSHKTGHIGGSMSSMDVLTVLYHRIMDVSKIKSLAPDRDRFVMSKGHCAEALYATLASVGLIREEELDTFTVFNTRLAEHPTRKIEGVEAATGALGHGLPLGVGMAIGLKASQPSAHVYVLTGDGELAEGSVWEAFMSAAKYKLDNLTVIIDRNRLQISGNTEDVMPLDSLVDKLKAFGMETIACNGHDYEEIEQALRFRSNQKPTAIILNTIKGKGSKVMEDKAEWHHLIPNDQQYAEIKQDLEQVLKEI